MKTTRVALYARISTDDGRQDPEVQLSQLREYCKQRGFPIYKEYVDHMSGAKDDRPSLNAMMNDVRKRKVDTVLVAKFDRFARSTKFLVLALEEFRQLGVDFISYSENVDTSTAMGKAMFGMISVMAEFERSLIQSRVVSGLRRARERGVILGRRRIGFDVEKATGMKKNGRSWSQISAELGVSVSTLRRTIAPCSKTLGNR